MSFPPIPPEIIAALTSATKKGITTIILPHLWSKSAKYFEKDHGSKVKEGTHKECSIELFGDRACIVLNDPGKIIFLTSDEIEYCDFIEKKFRPLRGHNYYYYNIFFKDGSKDYVRMRRKYKEAMERYM